MQGKATKKPAEINWFEWKKDRGAELMNWCHNNGERFWDNFELDNEFVLKVKTLEGTSYDVPEGYIIIRGVKGEYYPCEPKIFNETYNYY